MGRGGPIALELRRGSSRVHQSPNQTDPQIVTPPSVLGCYSSSLTVVHVGPRGLLLSDAVYLVCPSDDIHLAVGVLAE